VSKSLAISIQLTRKSAPKYSVCRFGFLYWRSPLMSNAAGSVTLVHGV